MKYTQLVIIFLLMPGIIFASKLDDLDKAPEGAHRNQMLLGAFLNIGSTLGDLINSVSEFIADNVIEMSQSGIFKKFMVSHITFAAGISFEWMPIDHMGLKFKARYSSVLQRTLFGTENENWSATLFQDISFNLGVVGHLTNRKMWDVSLAPLFGYSLAWFTPTVVASIPEISNNIDGYSNNVSTMMIHNFIMGAELAFTLFFKGGFYFSIGFEWIMNFLFFESTPDVSQTSGTYFSGKTQSFNHALTCYISVGYAFDN
jgi:hypothetical protein